MFHRVHHEMVPPVDGLDFCIRILLDCHAALSTRSTPSNP
ncbi:hypothetical protein EKH55_2354 [Sinorhizobium alkalisoli]|nr:hypothetical protein EKH55_2354 [Sinorhizobium alkalisoli]